MTSLAVGFRILWSALSFSSFAERLQSKKDDVASDVVRKRQSELEMLT